jgi:hypothetical protein
MRKGGGRYKPGGRGGEASAPPEASRGAAGHVGDGVGLEELGFSGSGSRVISLTVRSEIHGQMDDPPLTGMRSAETAKGDLHKNILCETIAQTDLSDKLFHPSNPLCDAPLMDATHARVAPVWPAPLSHPTWRPRC